MATTNSANAMSAREPFKTFARERRLVPWEPAIGRGGYLMTAPHAKLAVMV